MVHNRLTTKISVLSSRRAVNFFPCVHTQHVCIYNAHSKAYSTQQRHLLSCQHILTCKIATNVQYICCTSMVQTGFICVQLVQVSTGLMGILPFGIQDDIPMAQQEHEPYVTNVWKHVGIGWTCPMLIGEDQVYLNCIDQTLHSYMQWVDVCIGILGLF